MRAKELKAFDPLHCVTLSTATLSPVVHHQLLRCVDVEREVIFLARLHRGLSPPPWVDCLIVVGNILHPYVATPYLFYKLSPGLSVSSLSQENGSVEVN